jgi:NAD(P)H-dependent FMN reductase
MIKIKILTGSVRPGRFNLQPANWIYEIAKTRKDISVELIDLADVNLPFLDEPAPPSQYRYTKEHTKKWAKIIDEADGFIFVTPEYNHGVSPVLKNAIDYLWFEWHYKPVSYISYGSAAGGARSVEHLRGIAAETKMYDLREQIVISNYWNTTDEEGQYEFNEHHVHHANKVLDDLIFWATTMKKARKELNEKRP